MIINKLIAISALSAAAAFAQSWSQPVREVQKEAYSSTGAYCQISWGAGKPAFQQCTLLTVPADKILAIRQVSVFCTGRTGDIFARPVLATRMANLTPVTYSFAPLQSQPTDQTAHQIGRMAQLPVFQHAGPGTSVVFNLYFDGQQTVGAAPSCDIAIQGFFLPAVQ
jgi:hypothetical protein